MNYRFAILIWFLNILVTTDTLSQNNDTTKVLFKVEDFDIEDLVGADTSKTLKKNLIGSLSRQDVSTATKVSTRMDNIPAIAEVITAEQIAKRGYRHVADLLQDICDNHEDRSNWGIGEPVNQNTSFGFRFDTGQNILLLFNGQRLNGFLYGNRFGGEEYILDNIDRIEVVRGPGSALYGANAFTLVINMISKSGLPDNKGFLRGGVALNPSAKGVIATSSAMAKVGKTGIVSTSLRYSTEKGQKILVENTLFGNHELKDRIYYTADADIFYSTKNTNLYAKFTQQKRATFTGFNGVNINDLDHLTLSMYGYSVGGDHSIKLNKRVSLKLQSGCHFDNWQEIALIPIFKVNADGTALLRDSDGFPILDTVMVNRNNENINTSFIIDGQGADSRSIDLDIQVNGKFGRLNFLAGIYGNHDKITDARRPTEIQLSPFDFVSFQTYKDYANNWLFDENASRINIGLYSQADIEIGKRFLLNLGGRFDHFQGTGLLDVSYNSFNPRCGLVYINKRTGNFKLLYGEAFRVPNVVETLSSVALLGSPTNKPEELKMVQYQWGKNWGRNLRSELGGFSAIIQNPLRTDAELSEDLLALGYIGQFINAQSRKIASSGLNGKLVYTSEKLEFETNFTYFLSAKSGDQGGDIEYIPLTLINSNISIPLKWVNVNLSSNFRSNFTKSSTDPRAAVKDYVIINANLSKTLNSIPLSLNLMFRNLLNSNLKYPSSNRDFFNNFPARSREIIMGLSYTF